MLADHMNNGGSWIQEGRVTVVGMAPFTNAKTVQIAVSFASEDEQKLRSKVGLFHALIHLKGGMFIVVPMVNGNVEDTVSSILDGMIYIGFGY